MDDQEEMSTSSDIPLLSTVEDRPRSGSVFTRKSFIGETVQPKLGALSVCFIAYFNVSGGPWGTEDIISSIGPFPGLIGILIISFCWAYPMVLITAEMSTRFPEDGGYSIWVSEAFGEFWGFQESYWSWFSGVIDNSAYPVLAYETLSKIIYLPYPYICKLLLTLVFSTPTIFFMESFGHTMAIFFIIILLPFTTFIVYSFSTNSLNNLFAFRTEEGMSFSQVLDLLPILYWNFSGLDCVSTCAGEVRNPKVAYIKGLSWSLFLISMTYVATLAAAVISVEPYDWKDWNEGSLVTIMSNSMGSWMAVWVMISSLCGNMAMHAAELFEDSWQLSGMAETGLAPSLFRYRSKTFKTPVASISFSVLIICFLITLKFEEIVIVNNFFSVASALLEVFAFLFIRISESRGPSLVHHTLFLPQDLTRLLLTCAVPVSFGLFVLLASFFSSWSSIVIDSVAILVGLILYQYMKHKEVIRYQR